MIEWPRIEMLRRDHQVDWFDCGQDALNRLLVRYAFQNQQAEASQTYVALVGDEIVGFYTLVVAWIEYDGATQRLGKGLARHPIPLMLLGVWRSPRARRARGSARDCSRTFARSSSSGNTRRIGLSKSRCVSLPPTGGA